MKLDLPAEIGESKTLLLQRLDALLRERRAAGQITALVIDEAQSLSFEMLEEVRLLANIETASTKLLPLVLAGQPELATRLEAPNLRQLKQRVTLRARLEPFELADTAGYIASRIRTAGGRSERVFTLDAVKLIHEYSHGIPRTISVICDNALVTGMAIGKPRVDRATIVEVGRDLWLGSRPAASLRTATSDSDPAKDVAASRAPEGVDGPSPSSNNFLRRGVASLSRRVARTITE